MFIDYSGFSIWGTVRNYRLQLIQNLSVFHRTYGRIQQEQYGHWLPKPTESVFGLSAVVRSICDRAYRFPAKPNSHFTIAYSQNRAFSGIFLPINLAYSDYWP